MNTLVVLCLALYAFNGVLAAEDKPIRAIAILSGTGNARGNVTFTQNGCGQPVTVEVSVTGLVPGQHGFHVHERGDLSQGCASLAAHYNPDKLDHGAPDHEIRHVGDLGNIRANENGIASTVFTDSVISLTGSKSIIGRGVIVHEDIDDLGLGGHQDSKKTGNAGNRLACGVIGIFENDEEIPQCNGANKSYYGSIILMIQLLSLLAVFYF